MFPFQQPEATSELLDPSSRCLDESSVMEIPDHQHSQKKKQASKKGHLDYSKKPKCQLRKNKKELFQTKIKIMIKLEISKKSDWYRVYLSTGWVIFLFIA